MRMLNESQENELKIPKYLISGSASSREGVFLLSNFIYLALSQKRRPSTRITVP